MNKIARYTFTPNQQDMLNQQVELIFERAGEPAYLQTGMAGSFEVVRYGIEGHRESPLFALQSFSTEDGLMFGVLKISPPPDLISEPVNFYANFTDAVQVLTDCMVAFINEAKLPFRSLRLRPFSDDDRQTFQKLAAVFGGLAGHQGFAEFQDISQDAQACAIGVLVNSQQVIVATFAGVQGASGFECSVRNFQNQQVPGTQNLFASVGQAVSAHREYFSVMANSLRKKQKPWWRRMF